MPKKVIEKVGRWDVAGMFTRNLKKDIPEELQVVLRQVGLEAEGLMKKYIVGQEGVSSSKYKWKELSEDYLKYKKRKKLSKKILVATSSMVQSITSIAMYPKVFIGVKRGAKNKEGDDLTNIAATMEYGSEKRSIPARPFLQPINDLMKQKIEKENLIGKRILEYMKKKYSL